ncbi:MAG TPA: hypothetical protein VHT91_11920 [Kofleriaceae bacterium]|jgi:hypothetical protein|nr:hypothetical protein [Kofleriaceae bacterium]
MEHAFPVGSRSSDGERALTARQYAGGRLDRYDVDDNPEVTPGGSGLFMSTQIGSDVFTHDSTRA